MPERARTKQCIAKTKQRKRCKNKTKKSPYCAVHLRKIKHLEIKPSKIPNAGLGLFTTKNIIIPSKKKGRVSKPSLPIIDTYGGKILDYHPKNEYTVKLPRGKFLDGSDPTSSAARFANTCRKKSKHICKSNNAKFVISNSNPPVAKIVATRNIYYHKDNQNNAPNNEIYVSYGPGFRIP